MSGCHVALCTQKNPHFDTTTTRIVCFVVALCVCVFVCLNHPLGSLVANAPHLPVHLGAMSEAVRFQVAYYGAGGPGESEGLQVSEGARVGGY